AIFTCNMPLLSIVIPVYNEEQNVPVLYKQLSAVLSSIDSDCEILFIDDGSNDNTVEVIKDLNKADRRVKAIVLSRNFGHQVALSAGLENARGDMVVTIDGDMQ